MKDGVGSMAGILVCRGGGGGTSECGSVAWDMLYQWWAKLVGGGKNGWGVR